MPCGRVLSERGDGRQQAKSRLRERSRLYNGTIRDPGSCRSASLRAEARLR
jgi:hypothetical protein